MWCTVRSVARLPPRGPWLCVHPPRDGVALIAAPKGVPTYFDNDIKRRRCQGACNLYSPSCREGVFSETQYSPGSYLVAGDYHTVSTAIRSPIERRTHATTRRSVAAFATCAIWAPTTT